MYNYITARRFSQECNHESAGYCIAGHLLVTIPILSACDLFDNSEEEERKRQEELNRQIQEELQKAQDEYTRQLEEVLQEFTEEYKKWQQEQADLQKEQIEKALSGQ